MPPDVTVIIVTYNSEKDIRACLESVFKERNHVSQQVIVLDNNSSDRTAAIVREEFPQVKLLIPDSNLGFAGGNNEAARHADGEFLLLLNPDTIILRNAIDHVVDFARAHPSHGLYGGRTLKVDGSLEPSSCWGLPGLWSLTMFATGLSTVFRRHAIFDPESLGAWKRDSIREVGVITGCFLLTKSNFWKQLGGFDERFFMYGEDTDLSLRCRRAGCRPIICPDAELIHAIGRSSSQPIHKAILLYTGKAEYIRRRWSGLAQTLALALLATGVRLRAFGAQVARVLGGSPASPWIELWLRRGEWLPGYKEVLRCPLSVVGEEDRERAVRCP
jgi:N-acetylglucosaminyl-diphospho-decaprenol L-rhamnosyltransferase